MKTKTYYVPLLFAFLFERVGRSTTSYPTNWRIAPKHGLLTIAKIEVKPKRKRAPPHDFMECPICIHGTICNEGQAYMDDHD